MSEGTGILKADNASRDEKTVPRDLECEELLQSLHVRDDLLQRLEQSLRAWETIVQDNELCCTELEKRNAKKDEIIAHLTRDIDDLNSEVLKLRCTLDTAEKSVQQLQHELEGMQLEKQSNCRDPFDDSVDNHDQKAVEWGLHLQSQLRRHCQSDTAYGELRTDTHLQNIAPQTNTGYFLMPNPADCTLVMDDSIPKSSSSLLRAPGDSADEQRRTFEAYFDWSILEQLKGERDEFEQELLKMQKEIGQLQSFKAESESECPELTTKMQMREDSLTNENKRLVVEVQTFTKSIEDRDSKIDLLKEELKKKTELCANLQQTVNTLQAAQQQNDKELEIAQQKVKGYERNYKRSEEKKEAELNLHKEREENDEDEHQVVRDELQNVTESLQHKDAQISNMEKELNMKKEENVTLRKHIERSQLRAQDTENELKSALQNIQKLERNIQCLKGGQATKFSKHGEELQPFETENQDFKEELLKTTKSGQNTENTRSDKEIEEIQKLQSENQGLKVELESITKTLAAKDEEIRGMRQELKKKPKEESSPRKRIRKDDLRNWLEELNKAIEVGIRLDTNQEPENIDKENDGNQTGRANHHKDKTKPADAQATEKLVGETNYRTSPNGDNTNHSDKKLPETKLTKEIGDLQKQNEESKRTIIKTYASKLKELQKQCDFSSNRVEKQEAENKKLKTDLQEIKSSLTDLNMENQSLKEQLAAKQLKLIDNGQRIQESKNECETLRKQKSLLQQELDVNRNQFSECCMRWNQYCHQKEAALEQKEATERKMRKMKAFMYWHLFISLGKEQKSKRRMRGQLLLSVMEVSRELADLRHLLISKDDEHKTAIGELREENTRIREENIQIREELQAIQEESGTTIARLTDQLEELEVEKKSLQDEITHDRLMLVQKEGAVNIAHAWVQKMSGECVQCKAREVLFSKQLTVTQKLLEEKEQQYQALRSEADERERQMGQLRNDLQIQQDHQRVYQEKLELSNSQTNEQRDIVSKLKDEIERAERAIRQGYQREEEKTNEIQRREGEKQRLIRDILSLRRQLDAITCERDRLRRRCQQLQDELHLQ